MIKEDLQLDFKDVLFQCKRTKLSSRSQVNLNTTYKFRSSRREYNGVPIIASNMDTVGTFEMGAALHKHGMFTTIQKHYSPAEWLEFADNNREALENVALSTGISESDRRVMDQVLEQVPEISSICIDVANGYSDDFVEMIRQTRSKYPHKTIMAGNVVTGEMVEELILAGADIVKVGIGPGSVCTTRKKTGVGRPQLSAVIECAKAAHNLGGHVISDGGCTYPGDVCKAFGAGADFVMLGGMLAGHDQCPGKVMTNDSGQKFKLFYGMSSKFAQEKYNAGLATYRASEGKVVTVPYRGDVNDTVLDILGGLRSTCTYTNSAKLSDLRDNTTFYRVTQQTNEIFAGREVNM